MQESLRQFTIPKLSKKTSTNESYKDSPRPAVPTSTKSEVKKSPSSKPKLKQESTLKPASSSTTSSTSSLALHKSVIGTKNSLNSVRINPAVPLRLSSTSSTPASTPKPVKDTPNKVTGNVAQPRQTLSNGNGVPNRPVATRTAPPQAALAASTLKPPTTAAKPSSDTTNKPSAPSGAIKTSQGLTDKQTKPDRQGPSDRQTKPDRPGQIKPAARPVAMQSANLSKKTEKSVPVAKIQALKAAPNTNRDARVSQSTFTNGSDSRPLKRPAADGVLQNAKRVDGAAHQQRSDGAVLANRGRPEVEAKRSRIEPDVARSRKPSALGKPGASKASTLSYEELMRIAERNEKRNSGHDDYAELVLNEAKRRDEADREYAERKKARNTAAKTKPNRDAEVPAAAPVAAAVFAAAEPPKKLPPASTSAASKLAAPSSYVANLFKLSRPTGTMTSGPKATAPAAKSSTVTRLICDDSGSRAKAQVNEVDDDGDYDDYADDDYDDVDSFIDDSGELEPCDDGDGDVRRELAAVLKSKFRYDPARFKDEPVGDLRWMESSFKQISREERMSSRVGAREDAEEQRLEDQRRLAKRKTSEALLGATKRAK